MDYIKISAKSLEECITEACIQLSVTSDNLEYEVIQEAKTMLFGLKSQDEIIRAWVKGTNSEATEEISEKASLEEQVDNIIKETSSKNENKKNAAPKNSKKSHTSEKVEKNVAEVENKEVKEPVYVYDHEFINKAKEFSANVFESMHMKVAVDAKYNETDKVLEVELSGDEMGVLIGKRGQTLDSIQYLISLVVNRGSEDYIHVKVDTENYRSRRKATLENLAKNVAYKVRKNRSAVSLEPMNPYERRIIHSALQADKYVTTHSEGEEPFRRVVITLKK